METPNAWTARDRSREASNDYYQKGGATPLNGYNDGQISDFATDNYTTDEKAASQSSSVYAEVKQPKYSPNDHRLSTNPRDIKSENSMENYLVDNNPAYKK